jgi:xanthosine utilization system XapX-like protein
VKQNQKLLVIIYFMIPVFLITPYLLPLTEMQWFQFMDQNYNGIMLYPRVTQRDMGLMTPCSSSDAVYKDYAAVLGVLDEIPSAYIYENTATGSSATVSKLMIYLGDTDRAHVASHGYYSNTPVIVLNTDLDKDDVDLWSNQGSRCKLLFLSACDSMGHNGIQDNDLADAIMGKSEVSEVIGYKGTVDAGGAASYVAIFWAYHLWANGASGGISSDDSFYNAKDDLHNIMIDGAIQAILYSLITGLIYGILLAYLPIFFPGIPFVVPIILGFLLGLWGGLQVITWLNSLNSAYNNVVKHGTSVPGLTYSSGGGGGGACPFLSVFSGGEYVDEGILDIHNPDGYDLIVEHALSTTPQLIDGKYLLRLTEESQHFSDIDQVQLVAILENGQVINRPLFAATHSEFGDVKDALLESDDTRMLLFGEGYQEHSESDFVNLLFMGLGPDHPRVTQWMFIIEGHNMKDM